jgi:protein required for attachment to host cells
MPKRSSRTWVVIADSVRAKVLIQARSGDALTALAGAEFHSPDPSHHARDLGSDRPSRSIESVGGGRHAIEPKHDARRLTAAGFAGDLAGFLEHHAQEDNFDRLVIVAPSRMLGNFRNALGRHAEKKLVAELNEDLTKTPVRELPSHLEPILRF